MEKSNRVDGVIMPEHDSHQILTSEERIALEPGLVDRARTIQALVRLGTILGASDEVISALAANIRKLDPSGAEVTARALGTAASVLEELRPSVVEEARVAVEEPTEPANDLAPVDTEDPEEAGAADTGERAEDEADNEPLDLDEVEDMLEGREGYHLKRVEVFLDQMQHAGIDLGHVTAEDFSDEAMRRICEAYKRVANADEERQKIYIICTWGWLAGLEMEDLLEMYGAFKADAKNSDVHNARAGPLGVLARAQRSGILDLDLTDVFVELSGGEAGDDEDEDELEADDKVIGEDNVHETQDEEHAAEPGGGDEEEHGAGDVLDGDDESETEVEESAEQYDDDEEDDDDDKEEPGIEHRDGVVSRFRSLMSADVNEAAFRNLIDPHTTGEFMPSKQIVVEQLRNLVSQISPHGEILNQLDVSNEARATLRRLLGMGFRQGDKPVTREPEPMNVQTKGNTNREKDLKAEKLYDAMDALFVLLKEHFEKQSKPLETVSAPVSSPLQVDFSSGTPVLRS